MKYERLTKRISNNEVIHNCGKCPKVNVANYCSETNCATVILNRLAELEDKIESGKMLELPCKVGDKVYRWLGHSYDEWTVTRINLYITANGVDYTLCVSSERCGGEYFDKEDEEIEWFLTLTQAEARLKELQGE